MSLFELSDSILSDAHKNPQNKSLSSIYQNLVFGVDISELLLVFYNKYDLEYCGEEEQCNFHDIMVIFLNRVVMYIKGLDLELNTEDEPPSDDILNSWLLESAHSLGIHEKTLDVVKIINIYSKSCDIQKRNNNYEKTKKPTPDTTDAEKTKKPTTDTTDAEKTKKPTTDTTDAEKPIVEKDSHSYVPNSFLLVLADGELLSYIHHFANHLIQNRGGELGPDLSHLKSTTETSPRDQFIKTIIKWFKYNQITIPPNGHVIYEVFFSFLDCVWEYCTEIVKYSSCLGKSNWKKHKAPTEKIRIASNFIKCYHERPIESFNKFLRSFLENRDVSDLGTALSKHPITIKKSFNLDYKLNWSEIAINFATQSRHMMLNNFVVSFSSLIED